jgi:hypothetical protein
VSLIPMVLSCTGLSIQIGHYYHAGADSLPRSKVPQVALARLGSLSSVSSQRQGAQYLGLSWIPSSLPPTLAVGVALEVYTGACTELDRAGRMHAVSMQCQQNMPCLQSSQAPCQSFVTVNLMEPTLGKRRALPYDPRGHCWLKCLALSLSSWAPVRTARSGLCLPQGTEDRKFWLSDFEVVLRS